MPPHKTMPSIRTIFLLSTWDNDGVPISFFKIAASDVSNWISKTECQPQSSLYCLPDWYHRSNEGPATKFIYSCSDEFRPVTYANLPWNDTPFHQCVESNSSFQDSLSPVGSPELLFLCGNNRFSP